MCVCVCSDDYPRIDEDWAETHVHTHLDTVVEASGYFRPTETGDFERLLSEYRRDSGEKTPCEEVVVSVTVDSKDEEAEESESEESEESSAKMEEKRRYEGQRAKRRGLFEKRRRLKRELAVEVAKAKGLTGVATSRTTPSGVSGKRTLLSEAEIRRRVKRKTREEAHRLKLKRVRKTSHKQKASRQMRRDMQSGAADLW